MPRTLGRRRSISIAILILTAAISPRGLAQECGQWSELSREGPGQRWTAVMAFDTQRGVVVLHGGKTSDSFALGDTWEWDGERWNQVATGGPQARTEHAMVYDSVRGVMVMFGGRSSSFTYESDTWEWDGVAWREVNVIGPPARYRHAMAFDAERGVTVLFGGGTLSTDYEDTWEYDGQQWTRVTLGGPPPRAQHAMAYDPLLQRTVLFGGRDFADTWEWDGQIWEQINAEPPPTRQGAVMVYDDKRQQIIMHGGWNPQRYLFDLWSWSGSRWIPIGTQGPRARAYHSGTYDAVNQQLVVYGGRRGQDTWSDTWSETPRLWVQQSPQDVVVGGEGRAEFRVTPAGGGPFTYQWWFGNTPLFDGGSIHGAQTDTLTIDPARIEHQGLYSVQVRGACGETFSRDASLVVVELGLSVASSCPQGGPLTIEWSGGSPGGPVVLLFSTQAGMTTIPPGQPCAGTVLQLGAQRLRIIYRGQSDNQGGGTLNGSVGLGACGGRLQLLDLDFCATSNVARVE